MFIVLITKSYDKSVWCNFSVHCLYNNVLIISVSSVFIGRLLIGRYFELKLILTRYL